MLRILVVDDEHSVRIGLLRMLRALGHEALGASSGAEALAIALATPPNVILMDVMMPIQDGLDATRTIRKYPQLERVPIIALTASFSLSDEAQSLFNSVLRKPCRLADLLSAIEETQAG